MTFEVQTYDATDNTVYYETVEDAIDYEDARDVIAEKYPKRKVLAVQGKTGAFAKTEGLGEVVGFGF